MNIHVSVIGSFLFVCLGLFFVGFFCFFFQVNIAAIYAHVGYFSFAAIVDSCSDLSVSRQANGFQGFFSGFSSFITVSPKHICKCSLPVLSPTDLATKPHNSVYVLYVPGVALALNVAAAHFSFPSPFTPTNPHHHHHHLHSVLSDVRQTGC